jgi:hypothetical protein
MLNPTAILISAFGDHLERAFNRLYGSDTENIAQQAAIGGRLALEYISNSDAHYHDLQHTLHVTAVGLEIMKGKHMHVQTTPEDWLHYVVALLCHDIGYVRGVCSGDTRDEFVIDAKGKTITLSRGATDASLTPYHVERGKIFVRERLADVPFIDTARVVQAIELTRFPVPDDDDHQATGTEAGLVRAADLIGQLADPQYLQKLSKLYQEFVETGEAEAMGYKTAADLADSYPDFYWSIVKPYIADAIRYLEWTQEGKYWIAMLHSHVFSVEHGQFHFGPYRRTSN